MKVLKRLLTYGLAGCVAMPGGAISASSWQSGNISNITSIPGGLMIMLDSGMPDNCAGSPFGWMLIPEANKTIIATTLMVWAMGKKYVSVYTAGRPEGATA
jgi:hypothetical protein